MNVQYEIVNCSHPQHSIVLLNHVRWCSRCGAISELNTWLMLREWEPWQQIKLVKR